MHKPILWTKVEMTKVHATPNQIDKSFTFYVETYSWICGCFKRASVTVT